MKKPLFLFCSILFTSLQLHAQIITTVAGGGSSDADLQPATDVYLNAPGCLAFDHVGNMYIGETGRHTIRKVNLDGIIGTIAGVGTAGYSGDNGPRQRHNWESQEISLQIMQETFTLLTSLIMLYEKLMPTALSAHLQVMA